MKNDILAAVREIGPYRFEFICRHRQNFVVLIEDGEPIWESKAVRPGDQKALRKKIHTGLALLISRLSELKEKTLAVIHDIA
jgi:hypothetical protein